MWSDRNQKRSGEGSSRSRRTSGLYPLRLLLLALLLGGCHDASPPLNDAGLFDAYWSETGIDSRHSELEARPSDGPAIDPGLDSDGDGLPDGFEKLFPGFDPLQLDSDGDKIPDGEEDEDQDGLTAKQEWAAWQLGPVEGRKASPLHRDLLVEIDCQAGRAPSAHALAKAIEAFSALDLPNQDGAPGIALHLYFDEKDLPVSDLKDAEEQASYLELHGPRFGLQPSHVEKMVHAIFVAGYPANPKRGGETLAAAGMPEKSGILIYMDNLTKTYPVCSTTTQSAISLEEGVVSTLVHELGHAVQLGHDTEAGGGVNYYNIMASSIPACEQLQKRTRGVGNNDPSLGATETQGGPRFSKPAALLIKLSNKISVEAIQFELPNGYEM